MSKITFRADEDLVDAVEDLDASKSEIMRDALRTYLAADSRPGAVGRRPVDESLDELVARRVNEVLDERLDETGGGASRGDASGEASVNVRLEIAGTAVRSAAVERPGSEPGGGRSAGNRPGGDRSSDGPSGSVPSDSWRSNARDRTGAGEERTCLQCGATLEADHVYCPNCGEHAGRATLCECGSALDPQWSFCPECGRRTAAPDLVDR